MNQERIEVGDYVHVNMNQAQMTLCLKATVLAIPVATGDSWIFRDHSTQDIHYVSEGCTITLLSKKP